MQKFKQVREYAGDMAQAKATGKQRRAANLEVDIRDKSLLITCVAIVTGLVGRSFFEGNGILTNGWLSFDLYFWLIFAILLRTKQLSLSNIVI